jgi:hypothetical protein
MSTARSHRCSPQVKPWGFWAKPWQLVNKFGYSKTQPAATAFLDESLVDEINAGK